jgi:hypothetical protein
VSSKGAKARQVSNKQITANGLHLRILNTFIKQIRRTDLVILFLAVASLALRYLIPANIITNSPHDDLLGVQLAQKISNGEWLGAWDNRTLVKPAGYSIFLVFAKTVGLGPHILLHILFLCIFFYFIQVLGVILENASFSTAIQRISFLMFAFNPALYSGDFSRIYRLSLNTFFALFFIFLVFHLILVLEKNLGMQVINRSEPISVRIVVLMGVSYSGMVLTRSEAIWVLYPTAILLVYFIIQKLLKVSKSKRILILKRVLSLSLVAGITYVIPITIVKETNRKYYGVAILENYYSSEFARAFSLWTSVKGSTNNLSSVPINKSQREIVYSISPTASALKEQLETAPNTGWKVYSCAQAGICDESGPWFPFELRDVATNVFGIRSEVDFQSTFRKIADDIELACKQKVIECKRSGTETGTLNLLDLSKRMLLNDLGVYMSSLLNLDQANDITRRDGGSDPQQLELWNSVVKVDRLFMSNDKEIYLVLGDLLVSIKRIFIAFYAIFCLIGVLFLLCGRLQDKTAKVLRQFQIYLFLVVITYGLGMAIFHASTNVPSGNSLYTQPIVPVFCLLLLCGVIGAYFEVKGRVEQTIAN